VTDADYTSPKQVPLSQIGGACTIRYASSWCRNRWRIIALRAISAQL